MTDEELATLEINLKNGTHWTDTIQNKELIVLVHELRELRAYTKLFRETIRNFAKLLFVD